VAEVRQADVAEAIPYLGTVRSTREVLVTARIQGSVVRITRQEGEPVQEGDTVVLLSAPDLDAAVERFRADDIYWSNRLAADRRLAQSGAIPQEQVEATTRAALAANAALAEFETRRAWTRERSPLSGVVLEWRVEPGQHVFPGQPMILLGGDAREVRVPVVEEDVRRGVREGSRARLTPGTGESFDVEVGEVAPSTEGAGRAFTVTLPVPAERARDLRSGESIRVRFLLRESPAAHVVPVRAIAGRSTAPHVFLVSEGRAQRRHVTPGVEQDGWVAVTPPPPLGAHVAVSNLGALDDGVAVFAVPDTEVHP